MDFVRSATLPNTAATRFPSHTRHLCHNTRHSTTRRAQSGPWSPFYSEPKFQLNTGSSISRAISFSGTPLSVEKYSPIRELSDDISMSHLPVTWHLYTETPRQREKDAFGLYRTYAWTFPMACNCTSNPTLTIQHVMQDISLSRLRWFLPKSA